MRLETWNLCSCLWGTPRTEWFFFCQELHSLLYFILFLVKNSLLYLITLVLYRGWAKSADIWCSQGCQWAVLGFISNPHFSVLVSRVGFGFSWVSLTPLVLYNSSCKANFDGLSWFPVPLWMKGACLSGLYTGPVVWDVGNFCHPLFGTLWNDFWLTPLLTK